VRPVTGIRGLGAEGTAIRQPETMALLHGLVNITKAVKPV
jgi:hypothetical protein